MYFHAESVQLHVVVSRRDSELEVQRYCMKKNTLTVDPIMGALKMLDVKMTDVKLTDQCAGHEIAGHENDGPSDRT